MKKNTVLFFLAVFALTGCSPGHISARVYLYRAGQSFYKTDNKLRRIQKMPFEERKKYYGEACRLYFKAFQLDSSVFNLDEIEHALQCCESSEEHAITAALQDFYALYQSEHPVESDYGMMTGAAVSEG